MKQTVDAKLSSRALLFSTAALVVVALALAISLALVVGVASDRGADLNDLQAELTCRSVVSTDFSIVEGEIIASIAEALVGLSRNEDIERYEVAITEQVAELRALAESRLASIEECERNRG